MLGAAIKSVNTGIVIGDKLDNQIFGLSQLEPWKIKNSPIIVFQVFTEFIFFYHICHCMGIWPVNLISTG